MKHIDIKSFIPHVISVIAFIILGYLYFPDVLNGKVINQSDVSSWKGASHEIQQYRQATGEEPLWTGSMFCGMPANMISIKYPGNYISSLSNVINLFHNPINFLVIAMTGFYLLALCFKVNRWLAFCGAIAFAFCSYNFEIIQVGHATKIHAIAYMPWVLAGIVYSYHSKPLLGASLTGIAMSLEIQAGHPQITYYLGFIVLFFIITEGIYAYKNKFFPRFIKTSSFVLFALLLGFGCNVNNLWPTAEYSKYTMRGGSELTHSKNINSTGLTKEYATAWSYGIEETPNLLIPNFNGGASSSELSKNSETYKILRQGGVSNADQMIKQMPTYWGPQAFTAGPMYMGAISIFLFILGLLLIKGQIKWWLGSVSLLAIILSWGQHFMLLYGLLFDYLPLFDKFRVPSMILIILQLTIPLLGIYTLQIIFNGTIEKTSIRKALKIALGITGGFCALFGIIPTLAGDFSSISDAQYPQWLQQSLPADRLSLLRNDAFRSLTYILLAGILIWASVFKQLKLKYALPILAFLIIADLWTINKRYMNSSHFVTAKEFNNQFIMRPVDQIILQDKDPNYRVLDLTINTFNDSHISYYHKTIGGYSAAKLQRYQDLIEQNLAPEIQFFINALQSNSQVNTDSLMKQLNVINMLNAKYVIINPNSTPLLNRSSLGNAWFVKDYRFVDSADEEINTLSQINPKYTAIINRQFENELKNRIFSNDSLDYIRLLSYRPNQLEYQYKTSTPQLALFSEIYYPLGWKAYIDEKETSHFRANYILRSMVLPAGEHHIKFEYKPESYYKAAWISRICSGILLLSLITIAGFYLFRLLKQQ